MHKKSGGYTQAGVPAVFFFFLSGVSAFPRQGKLRLRRSCRSVHGAGEYPSSVCVRENGTAGSSTPGLSVLPGDESLSPQAPNAAQTPMSSRHAANAANFFNLFMTRSLVFLTRAPVGHTFFCRGGSNAPHISFEIRKAGGSCKTRPPQWSRRRESNPPESAWEADAIPLGDACKSRCGSRFFPLRKSRLSQCIFNYTDFPAVCQAKKYDFRRHSF